MRGGLQPVIVGYGRAGRDLHHAAVQPLLDPDDVVLVVDPRRPTVLRGGRWVQSTVDAVRVVQETGTDVGRCVFHVTTPPATHLAWVEQLIDLGARRIILEKPVAVDSAQARRIAKLGEAATILPTSIWLSSNVTAAVEEWITAGEVGTPTHLHFEQSKPRFRRTIQSVAHGSAFEIELPHQVLLATHLAGPTRRLETSCTWPMALPDRTLSAMGGARVTLSHLSGQYSTLVTDLTCPVRRRRLCVSGTRGQIVADYPVSGDDDFGQLRIAGRGQRTILQDAPLSQFIATAYAHLRGEGAPPRGDLAQHVQTIELLEHARETAVTAADENMEFETWRA